jgi:hypothetical protein
MAVLKRAWSLFRRDSTVEGSQWSEGSVAAGVEDSEAGSVEGVGDGEEEPEVEVEGADCSVSGDGFGGLGGSSGGKLPDVVDCRRDWACMLQRKHIDEA